MTALALERLHNHALAGIDLEVSDGELLALVGPSGAGKSTLLHAIAGLVPYTGIVRFDGRPVDRLQPFERRVSVVFQDLFLFPHLTARSNVRIAMKPLGLGRRTEADRTRDFLARFGLEALADRRPGELSGGEKQRVALARAVASSPRLLLLDEPLSSLDAQTAQGLRSEIHRFQRDLSITTLLVTHNLREAAELGDRIAEVQAGGIVRTTPPEAFQRRLRKRTVAAAG